MDVAVGGTAFEPVGADQQVIETVAVDIARTQRATHVTIGLQAADFESVGAVERSDAERAAGADAGAAEHDIGLTDIGCRAGFRLGRSYDDVGVSVAVQVAGRRNPLARSP